MVRGEARRGGDPGSVLYGKETCRTFRETIPKQEASLRMAGIFNTGTISWPCYELLYHSTRIATRDYDGKFHGKHIILTGCNGGSNTAGHETATNKKTVVLVRDPVSTTCVQLELKCIGESPTEGRSEPVYRVQLGLGMAPSLHRIHHSLAPSLFYPQYSWMHSMCKNHYGAR